MTHSDGIVFRSGVMCFTYLESCRKIFFYSLNTSRLTLICCHKVSIYIHSTYHQDCKKQAECNVLTIIISIMSLSVNIISQNEQHIIKYPHISKLTAEECPFADTGERRLMSGIHFSASANSRCMPNADAGRKRRTARKE